MTEQIINQKEYKYRITVSGVTIIDYRIKSRIAQDVIDAMNAWLQENAKRYRVVCLGADEKQIPFTIFATTIIFNYEEDMLAFKLKFGKHL